MKVFVLCGGEGTRLRPYTYAIPKPMLTVGGKPILWYVVSNLKKSGFTDLVLTVGYRHEQITEYFGDGKKFEVKTEYLVEDEPKNTAGSILPYKGRINESFVVVMGDHITNIDIHALLTHHKKSKAIGTVALQRSRIPLEYGVAKLANGKIAEFVEKPVLENFINTAIYVFEPEVFEYIREKEDFAKQVLPRLLKEGKQISAYLFEDVWFDIGRVSDYERLNELFNISNLMNNFR